MCKFPTIAAVLLGIVLLAPVQAAELETPTQRISYTIGMDIGRSLSEQAIDLDLDVLIDGLRARYLGEATLLSEDEALAEREAFIERRQQELDEARGREAERNFAEGEAFLAENRGRAGVQETESGLQYRVVEQGDGRRPSASDRVTVHYRGKLISGVEFDSSYARGQPATFGLSQVIPGWTEGLQLMNEGSRFEFFIPPELAYGEAGRPGAIGPNSTLIFEVELLQIAE